MKPQSPSASLFISRPQRQPEDVGSYAYRAIKKYVNHILQQEKGVLARRDPEYLHQMRVGLRRLRATCKAFEFAVVLPVSDRKLKQLGKILGQARDLDVLHIWLEGYTRQANLKKSEANVLHRLKRTLEKQRKKYVVQTDKLFHSKKYKRLFKALNQWLQHPQYGNLASLPMDVALPDIQMSAVSQLLLHPGWLVTNNKNPTQLKQVHDLRKVIKNVRYQMSLFREFYGEEYRSQVSAFRQLQDVLGELQDKVVLQNFLVKFLGKKWAKKLPRLEHYLQQRHRQLWQQWLTLRQPYGSFLQRDVLHRLLLA